MRTVAALVAAGLAFAYALALTGCDAPTKGCRIDLECHAGEACVVGVCRTIVTSGGGGDDGGAGAPDLAGGGADLAQPIPDGFTPDAPVGCGFNGDGVITRAEAPFAVGLGGIFAVPPPSTTVTVTTRPTATGWDFSAPVAGERRLYSQLLSPSGTWWAADFPSATYAERLDDANALFGVYRVGADALELLGVVSETDGLTRTKLTYATPIPVMKFPLREGDRWTAESGVSGLANGFAFVATERYTFTVDKRGTTKVPLGQFDTLRLRFDYRQTYGLYVTTRISYIHLAECYGAVARIRSTDGETDGDFTEATEYRRLATP
jgi:hypothetical protein